MKRNIRIFLVLNGVYSLLFVVSNYALWTVFNGNLIKSIWNPIFINLTKHSITSENTISTVMTFFTYCNFPFIIFVAIIITNMCFIVSLLREQKAQIKK
jgi:hypothetical protein